MPALLSAAERKLAEAIYGVSYANPFLPQRLEFERAILGDVGSPRGSVWNLRVGPQQEPDQITQLRQRIEPLAETLFNRLLDGAGAGTLASAIQAVLRSCCASRMVHYVGPLSADSRRPRALCTHREACARAFGRF